MTPYKQYSGRFFMVIVIQMLASQMAIHNGFVAYELRWWIIVASASALFDIGFVLATGSNYVPKVEAKRGHYSPRLIPTPLDRK